MVIFCTKIADRPLTFRKLVPEDLLQSRTRPHFLPPRHEVRDEDFTADMSKVEESALVLRKNDTAALESWHEKSALGHWVVMRTVLPDFVWENW